MSPGDLTTLANLRAWVGVQSTADDPLLTRLVSAVSAFAVNYCHRTFLQQSVTETRNGTGGDTLSLAQYPVTAVASLQVDQQTIDPRAGIGQPGYVLVGTNQLALDGGLIFTRGRANVLVSYTAGYVTAPLDLEQAVIECCGSWYKRHGRIDEVSKNVQGEVITFSVADVPAAAKAVFNEYSRVFPA